MATEVVSREAQREFPRWPVTSTKPVRVDLGPAGTGQIVDISAGGMRVKMMAPLRRDAEIPVRIEVPEQTAPVQCSGVVVWSKPNGAAGVRFTKLTDEHKAVLTAWLTALEQAASESSPQRDEFARITAQITAMKLNNADALSLIARRAAQLATAVGVAVALGKSENMVCLARSGDAPELGTQIRSSSGLMGECVRGRKLVLVHDASTDPRAIELQNGSALILPLLVNGELRGVMQVVCAQAHAFDTKTMELLQKLADAVIFVTHNVMPQRRIARVTPLPKPTVPSAPVVTNASETGRFPAVTPSDPKPSDSLRTTAFSAPSLNKLSETGKFVAYTTQQGTTSSDTSRLSAFTATPPIKPVTLMPTPAVSSGATIPRSLVSEAGTAMEVGPLADSVRVPAPGAMATKPGLEVVRPLASKPLQPVIADPGMTFHTDSESSSKIRIIAIVILLLAAPIGYFLWHHHAQQHVEAAAPASTPSATPATAVPESTAAVMPPQPPTVMASTSPVTAAKSPGIDKPHPIPEKTPEKASVDKKSSAIEPASQEPAPMVLASGRRVEQPTVDEPITAAPSATQLAIHTSASIPGVAIPGPISSPKLAAPVATTWTGGNLLQRVPPIYPQTALARGLEGPVQLNIVVTAKGTVDKIRIVEGNPILAQAAVAAVKRWRYEPFKADGQAVDKEASITLNFKIPR